MGKKKLVLDKNTVKSIKIKTEVKTGDSRIAGTMTCATVCGGYSYGLYSAK